MLSKNEWDQLETVIVGIADNAKIPAMDKSLRCINYADKKDISDISVGSYPTQVIEEANEDLEILSNFLHNEGVKVLRPNDTNPSYYNYCPRDTVLVHDNKIIASPNPLRARATEYKSMEHHFRNYSGVITIDTYRDDSLYNEECLSNPDILALTEKYPSFDAANILRANDDLYYLVSNTGNKKGAERLREITKKNVHLIESVYSYIHIDSTIAFLREGLMLLNPARIKNIEQLPKSLQSWDIIWSPEPVDIGHYPGYCNASVWININLLSVNPNLVILEERQHNLRKELEKHNIDCAMLPMRHARTLGGCFHCVTVDIERS